MVNPLKPSLKGTRNPEPLEPSEQPSPWRSDVCCAVQCGMIMNWWHTIRCYKISKMWKLWTLWNRAWTQSLNSSVKSSEIVHSVGSFDKDDRRHHKTKDRHGGTRLPGPGGPGAVGGPTEPAGPTNGSNSSLRAAKVNTVDTTRITFYCTLHICTRTVWKAPKNAIYAIHSKS